MRKYWMGLSKARTVMLAMGLFIPEFVWRIWNMLNQKNFNRYLALWMQQKDWTPKPNRTGFASQLCTLLAVWVTYTFKNWNSNNNSYLILLFWLSKYLSLTPYITECLHSADLNALYKLSHLILKQAFEMALVIISILQMKQKQRIINYPWKVRCDTWEAWCLKWI